MQIPWLEQFLGQRTEEQSFPVIPDLQKQVPFLQSPFQLQELGQSVVILQSSDMYPISQLQTPFMQIPLKEQLLGQEVELASCLEEKNWLRFERILRRRSWLFGE